MTEAAPRSSRSLGLAIAGVLAASWLVCRQFLDLGLLGADTYPMIATSRVREAGDLVRILSRELMDGRYVEGDFYRPLTSLSFALDHALWGLAPMGWHVTDMAILAVNGVLVLFLTRRLLGGRSVLGPLLAALVFVVHPVHVELLPVPARRADALCLLFLLATSVALPRSESARGGRARAALAGCLALGALGAKETGIAVLPLVLALAALERWSGGPAAGRRRALLAVGAATALFAVLRTAVLGGLGGHAGTSAAGIRSLLADLGPQAFLESYLGRVLYPQPFLDLAVSKVRVVLWSVAAGGALLALALAAHAHGAGRAGRRRDLGVLAFLALWALGLLAVSAASGRVHDWYAMLLVAPYAVGHGYLADRALCALAAPRWRAVGAATGAALALLAGSHAAQSSMLREYPGWRRASDYTRQVTAHIEAAVRRIPAYPARADRKGRASRTVVLDRFVPWIPPAGDGSGIRSATIGAAYTFQAWAELALPERRVHVDFATALPLPSSPPGDVVHVVLYTGVLQGD